MQEVKKMFWTKLKLPLKITNQMTIEKIGTKIRRGM